MKKSFLFSAALMLLCSVVNAQSYQFDNVKRFTTRSMGEIVSDNEVKGYYVFYPEERADRKTIAFKIALLDDNLNKVSEFDLVRPKKYVLLESSFNQNTFIFNFYDPKAKAMEYVTFDRSGKELGSITSDKLSMMERATLNQIMQNPEITTTNIFPIGDEGFVRYQTIDRRKDGFGITRYDNNLKEVWNYESDPDSKMIEIGSVLHVDENYVLVQITKSKSAMTSKFDTYLTLLDGKTGKPYYDFQMQDNNEAQLSVLNAFMIDDDGGALLLGEFYALGDNVLKDKSLGLYVRVVEKNGEYGLFKKYRWDHEIARVKEASLDDEMANKDKGTNLIYFHKFVRSADGHIFAIAEQYRKQASALGITAAALSGGGGSGVAVMEVRLTNMVVAEFDDKLDLVDYELIPKKKRRVNLPEGMGLMSPQKMGYYMEQTGAFDYCFTSVDKADDSYHAVYMDSDRRDEANEKADAMVGSIDIVDGKVSNQKFPVNTDANLIWISPAKPGYVLINEYFRKGKRLHLRLEKVSI